MPLITRRLVDLEHRAGGAMPDWQEPARRRVHRDAISNDAPLCEIRGKFRADHARANRLLAPFRRASHIAANRWVLARSFVLSCAMHPHGMATREHHLAKFNNEGVS